MTDNSSYKLSRGRTAHLTATSSVKPLFGLRNELITNNQSLITAHINYFSIFFTAVKSAFKSWETSDKFRNTFSRSATIFRAVSQVKVKE